MIEDICLKIMYIAFAVLLIIFAICAIVWLICVIHDFYLSIRKKNPPKISRKTTIEEELNHGTKIH